MWTQSLAQPFDALDTYYAGGNVPEGVSLCGGTLTLLRLIRLPARAAPSAWSNAVFRLGTILFKLRPVA